MMSTNQIDFETGILPYIHELSFEKYNNLLDDVTNKRPIYAAYCQVSGAVGEAYLTKEKLTSKLSSELARDIRVLQNNSETTLANTKFATYVEYAIDTIRNKSNNVKSDVVDAIQDATKIELCEGVTIKSMLQGVPCDLDLRPLAFQESEVKDVFGNSSATAITTDIIIKHPLTRASQEQAKIPDSVPTYGTILDRINQLSDGRALVWIRYMQLSIDDILDTGLDASYASSVRRFSILFVDLEELIQEVKDGWFLRELCTQYVTQEQHMDCIKRLAPNEQDSEYYKSLVAYHEKLKGILTELISEQVIAKLSNIKSEN